MLRLHTDQWRLRRPIGATEVRMPQSRFASRRTPHSGLALGFKYAAIWRRGDVIWLNTTRVALVRLPFELFGYFERLMC